MPEPLEVLLADGLVRREGERTRTTPRWQGAMARAALALQRTGAPWRDLRLPIAAALAGLIEAMVPVEEAELAAAWGGAPSSR